MSSYPFHKMRRQKIRFTDDDESAVNEEISCTKLQAIKYSPAFSPVKNKISSKQVVDKDSQQKINIFQVWYL